MSQEEIKLKQCFVMIEPLTPKADIALSAELRIVINERNMLTSKSKKKILSALDEINATSVASKRKERKHKAIQEILESEEMYLKQLENVMIYFMKPMHEKNIVSPVDYEMLFGTIRTIYNVNGELLFELKENILNVASAFSKLAPFFKMYSVYAYDYKKCLNMLEKLHSTNPQFSKFLISQETRPEVQAKLSSLLITPIQRIPRYCLLLRQVLDNTEVTDPDYEVLKDSLKKLESVARHVNTLIEDQENSQRLLELVRCLKNGKQLVIKPGRKLIKEGVLSKSKSDQKANEKIYLVLMSDVLMCCKIRKSNLQQPNSLKCDTIYPLNKCKITQNKNTKMFEITCIEEKLVLYHSTGSESSEWITIIEKTIAKCIRNRMTLRKGSSSRRPADKNNLKPYIDIGVSPGVSRIRKRRRTDEEEDLQNETEKIIKMDQKRKTSFKCLPLRLPKRKPQAEQPADEKPDSEKMDVSVKGKDSLFPLREQLAAVEPVVVAPPTECSAIVPYQENVFIFGRSNNQNRGFSFKLGNIFTGLGNSFKRVFGFK